VSIFDIVITNEFKKRFSNKQKDNLEEIVNIAPWLLDATFSNAVISTFITYIVWHGGIWERGTWVNGAWEDGIWKDGYWLDGQWHDGLWLDGIWEEGIWLDGDWLGGRWRNGLWHDGNWRGGIWEYGNWQNGIIFNMCSECSPRTVLGGEMG